MRRVVGLGAMLLAIALGPGCDSDTPLQAGEQTLGLRVTATNAVVRTIDVWNVFEDQNNDEMPDGMVTLWCQLVFDNDPMTSDDPHRRTAISVPWTFAIQISVLREGASERELLTSPEALEPRTNIAEYDTSVVLGVANPQPLGFGASTVLLDGSGAPCGAGSPGCTRYRFANARRLTAANFDVIHSDTNLLHQLNPALFNGVCQDLVLPGASGADLSYYTPPMIDDQVPPHTVTLGQGDTLFVEARRFDFPPPGFVVDGQAMPMQEVMLYTPAGLAATITLDGLALSSLQGTTSTQPIPGGGFSFSFTVQ